MGSLSNNIQLLDQDYRSVSATPGGVHLGQRAVTSDGKAYRYGVNGTGSGTALDPGKLAQGALSTSNHVNRTGVTAVAGTSTLTWTVGATAAAANAYFEGYLVINAGAGAGQALEIAGNTAITAGGSYSVTVNLTDQLITASAVGTSKFSLYPNLYSACIIQAATVAAESAGVPNISIPDTYYGWFQVGGTCSVLQDAGQAAVGCSVVASDDTAGSVGPYETDAALGPVLGVALITGVSTEYQPVFLTIS